MVDFDIADRDAVHAAVLAAAPEVVYHCAAFTAVDDCESKPELAYRGQRPRPPATSPRRPAGSAPTSSTSPPTTSSTAPRPRRTSSGTPRTPLSMYGKTKLGGEQEIRAMAPTGAIARTAWVCGANGGNMVKTVLGLLAADPKREFDFVDDQHGCPTFTADLAPALRRLAVARLPGTFHITNQGPTTWYGFVQAIVVAAGGSADQVRPDHHRRPRSAAPGTPPGQLGARQPRPAPRRPTHARPLVRAARAARQGADYLMSERRERIIGTGALRAQRGALIGSPPKAAAR